jgi:hypothetical protein
MHCYPVARLLMQAIQISLHHLCTISAAVLLFAYSTVALTSAHLKCSPRGALLLHRAFALLPHHARNFNLWMKNKRIPPFANPDLWKNKLIPTLMPILFEARFMLRYYRRPA